MQSHALATSQYLGVPEPALGMAAYSLACAQVATNDPTGAAATLTEVSRLNPDLRANARRGEPLGLGQGAPRFELFLGALLRGLPGAGAGRRAPVRCDASARLAASTGPGRPSR
jgi:hypothetical protein